MKKTKTLLSVLLTLALLLSLGASTVAAGTGQISVVDAGSYRYRAYKVFDATVSGSGDVTYTITADSPWLPVVYDTTNKGSKITGLKFTPDNETTPTIYTVEEQPGFNAADFANNTLKSSIPNTAPYVTFSTTDNHSDTTNDLDAGYYLVVSSPNDSFDSANMQVKASLTTVLDKKVLVQNKNDMPFDKTVDGNKTEGVKIGQILNFKIESKVPTDIAYDETFYSFIITDTMDKGLTFDKTSFKVKIDGTEITTLIDTESESAVLSGDKVRFGKNGKIFELSLDMLSRGKPSRTDPNDPTTQTANPLAGKLIEVTYQATVNKEAAAVVSENNAVLTYGNDPDTYIIKDTQTKVYDSRILIDKFENGAPEQKLEGAQFKLVKYTTDGSEGTGVDKSTGSVTAFYYKAGYNPSSELISVNWVTDGTETTETTKVDGSAVFAGLKDGIYYLEETQAPNGYVALTEPIKIMVDGSHSITPGMSEEQIAAILTNTSNVSNTPGTVLPSTGGIGTTIFYLAGSVLIVGALLVLMLRKRANEG